MSKNAKTEITFTGNWTAVRTVTATMQLRYNADGWLEQAWQDREDGSIEWIPIDRSLMPSLNPQPAHSQPDDAAADGEDEKADDV